jgi:hypothetical protein
MPTGNRERDRRIPDWAGVTLFTLLHLCLFPVWIFFMILSQTVTVAMYWVFYLPLAVGDELQLLPKNLGRLEVLLILLNSLLYGFVWWFTWRMARVLFCRQPAE